MNNCLFRIIIDDIIFFGLSDEDCIDPDVAIQQLERIAADLKSLSLEDQCKFIQFAREIADEEIEVNSERGEFLLSLGDQLGIG